MTTDTQGTSRRRLLASLGAVAGGAAIVAVGPAGTASAAAPDPEVPTRRRWTAASSQNGWPVGTAKSFTGHRVEGSNAVVALRSGAAAAVLLYVARRYHYEIRSLAPGDVFGYTTDHTVTADYESNYLSGTAIAVLPGLYPAGSSGNLFPLQLTVLRDILAQCQGVVRWGGDDAACPKEGHFQLDVAPGSAELASLARTLGVWETTPGKGAGAPGDPFAASRLAASRKLAARQRRS